MATVQLVGIAGDLQGLAHQDLPQLELEAEVKALTTDGDVSNETPTVEHD
jgi:hypothetical protein